VFGGKYTEFCIIFSLQYSISINTFEVDPLAAVVVPVGRIDPRFGGWPSLGSSLGEISKTHLPYTFINNIPNLALKSL
jgi:hypothetical protein